MNGISAEERCLISVGVTPFVEWELMFFLIISYNCFFVKRYLVEENIFVCRFVNDVLHIWNGKIVVLSLPNSKLFGKVIEGIEGMAGMGFLIIFPVAAFRLAVMPWSKGFDLLVPGSGLSRCFLKKPSAAFS